MGFKILGSKRKRNCCTHQPRHAILLDFKSVPLKAQFLYCLALIADSQKKTLRIVFESVITRKGTKIPHPILGSKLIMELTHRVTRPFSRLLPSSLVPLTYRLAQHCLLRYFVHSYSCSLNPELMGKFLSMT